MEIIWHGQSCFTLKGSKSTVVTDLYNDDYGLKVPALSADILTVSHQHRDHNNTNLTNKPYIIDCPGEYEIKNIFISGIPAAHDSADGQERGRVTIYAFNIDGYKICHLSDLGEKLDEKQLEKIGDVDVLLIPVGGVYTLDGKHAKEVVEQIEPKVVIPMHYLLPDLNIKIDGVENFLKEMGIKESVPQSSLILDNLNMSSEKTTVILLEPKH